MNKQIMNKQILSYVVLATLCSSVFGGLSLENFLPSLPSVLIDEIEGYAREIKMVSAGGDYICAIKNDGTLACWGDDLIRPTNVPERFQTEIAQVSLGGHNACAVKVDGTLGCWGMNKFGETTVPEGFQTGIAQVSLGEHHTCAIKADGSLGCWGSNQFGETTVLEGFRAGIAQVSAGRDHTCAVTVDGALGCWGNSKHDQTTVQAGFQTKVKQVSIGINQTCAVKVDGALGCWGKGQYAQTKVPNEFQTGIQQISVGTAHICAIKSNGTLGCWGTNLYKECDMPEKFRDGIVQVSAGSFHTCAIKVDGSLGCWGSNTHKQICPLTLAIINADISRAEDALKDYFKYLRFEYGEFLSKIKLAILFNDKEMIKLLINYKRPDDGATPLMVLLGIAYNADNYSTSSFMQNAYHKPLEMLLKHGADPLVARNDGTNAIDLADKSPHKQIKVLIANHVYPNGKSLLDVAKERKDYDLMRTLFGLGAELNLRSKEQKRLEN